VKPLQWVGVAAIVVFGGKLILDLTRPERDPFALPGAMPMSDTLGASDPVEFPMPSLPETPVVIPPPLDLLIVGSDAARDDLYCSGIMFAAHRASGDEFSAEAQARRDRAIALAEAGVAKLLSEGAAQTGETGAIADVHSTRALDDFTAGTPRISVEECEARPVP
jgi:hypothetical protein